ncbi:hypothetical protein F5Y18DRAFT_431694 [Xylariaceae sp. FL1019]|nr:hypothetical protein F5Y18DRAFT_431694 [Xylariaceae sp. FL1019]
MLEGITIPFEDQCWFEERVTSCSNWCKSGLSLLWRMEATDGGQRAPPPPRDTMRLSDLLLRTTTKFITVTLGSGVLMLRNWQIASSWSFPIARFPVGQTEEQELKWSMTRDYQLVDAMARIKSPAAGPMCFPSRLLLQNCSSASCPVLRCYFTT